MKLKALTLHGFKSFADRTVVEFPDGVAAVVGPNGSGKSNISDAIRWVLGEQSLRLLRGTRLEDVIFVGSESKRPVGMAEVSLTFDNSAKRIPLDYSEVSVTRRVYRSGESEFLINRNPCRLRDIQELFMDTGLGKGSLSIVGQGEVDAVLSARPEDRRAFLEEAAGITRYRSRKEEALQRLSKTEENLVRLDDIIGEVERQLGPLAKQAETARTYKELSDELRRVEGSVLWARVYAREDEEKRAKERLEHLHAERTKTEEAWRTLEQEAAAASDALEQLEDELTRVRARGEEARNALLQGRHRGEMAGQRLSQAQREESERRQRIEELARRRSEIREEIQEARERLEAANRQGDTIREELTRFHEAIAKARQEREERDAGLLAARQRLRALGEEAATLSVQTQTFGQTIDTLHGQLEEHKADEQRLQEALKGLRAAKQEAQRRLHEVKGELESTESSTRALNQEQVRLDGARKEAENRLNQVRRHLQEATAKRNALAEMDEAREGYNRGVKAVLEVAKAKGWALHGAVAELVDVPAELETAIEVALGSAQQNIVAQGDEDAKAAIEYLKARGLGRATFLPLESLRPQRVGFETAQRLQHIDGAVGVAADLVGAQNYLRPAVDYLLGRVAVAHDLDAALRIARQTRGFSRVVTLDGDVLVPQGAMTGGSRPGRSQGLLGRSRRVAELEAQVEKYRNEVAKTEKECDYLTRQLGEVERQRADLRERLHQLQLVHHATIRDVHEAERRVTETQTEALRRKEKEAELNARLAALITQKAEASSRLEEVTKEQEAQNNLVASLEAELGDERDVEEGLREQTSKLQAQMAVLSQTIEERTKEIDRLCQEEKALETERQKEEARLNHLLHVQNEAAHEAEAAQRAVEEATQRAQEVARAEESLLARRERLRSSQADLSARAQDVQQRLNQLHKQVVQAEVDLERMKAALDTLYERLQAIRVSRPSVEEVHALGDLAPLERQVRSLKARLDALGPVNPDAIQEYDALTERHGFLTTQKSDLLEAKEQLREVIARIDKESRVKFANLFRAVQKEFQTTFARLFGGGSARLELVEPDNPLESGIDIFVQPPGKRLQNLLALSGGERALAAIALLFAILAVRPSPFCVLDEIDAALDEANLERFSRLVREFSTQTQFIIITHRQGTMEGADALFGVTMEGSGVSRLVAVKVDEIKSA